MLLSFCPPTLGVVWLRSVNLVLSAMMATLGSNDSFISAGYDRWSWFSLAFCLDGCARQRWFSRSDWLRSALLVLSSSLATLPPHDSFWIYGYARWSWFSRRALAALAGHGSLEGAGCARSSWFSPRRWLRSSAVVLSKAMATLSVHGSIFDYD